MFRQFTGFRISRTFQLLLVFSNALVLFINLFVGLLVYQNPLLALMDGENLAYVLIFALSLSIVLYGLGLVVNLLEKPGARSRKS
ncbi:MAG: hypothetical protein ACXWV0_04705 [Flavisolibacter sp.]